MILNETQCHVIVTTGAYAPMPSKKSSTKHTVIIIKKRTYHTYTINRKWTNSYAIGTKENATTLMTKRLNGCGNF